MGFSLWWHLLWSTVTWASVVVAHGPSCSTACGIFLDQGSNLCPLHWQADSYPLCHEGSPQYCFNHDFPFHFSNIFPYPQFISISFIFKVSICFPGSSAGKESAYKEGDPGSIPGSGRLAGEGIGYPLQYSWASLVAQMVKNLPAMRETCVRPLGWEGKGYLLQYSGLENSMDYIVHRVTKSQTLLSDFHFYFQS